MYELFALKRFFFCIFLSSSFACMVPKANLYQCGSEALAELVRWWPDGDLAPLHPLHSLAPLHPLLDHLLARLQILATGGLALQVWLTNPPLYMKILASIPLQRIRTICRNNPKKLWSLNVIPANDFSGILFRFGASQPVFIFMYCKYL
jgi:hypothetical protein